MEYAVLFIVVAVGMWIVGKVVPTLAGYVTPTGQQTNPWVLIALSAAVIAGVLVVAGMAHKHIGNNLEKAV